MNTYLNFSHVMKESTHKHSRIETTLLDLIQAVNQVTTDDRLVAATVANLVNSGHAELMGNSRGKRIMIE
jgi:hypothetical protein